MIEHTAEADDAVLGTTERRSMVRAASQREPVRLFCERLDALRAGGYVRRGIWHHGRRWFNGFVCG